MGRPSEVFWARRSSCPSSGISRVEWFVLSGLGMPQDVKPRLCIRKEFNRMEVFLPDQFIGQTVGNCQIEQVLSHGPVSIVYRAQHLTTNRPVSLTVFLLPEELPPHARQQFRARFLREASALACVRHPHLVPLYAYGEWDGFP